MRWPAFPGAGQDRVFRLGRIERLADLTPSAVSDALGKLRSQGLSARSVEAHAVAAKSLSRWVWRDGRSADYALAGLAKPSASPDRRLGRRPLSEAELKALLHATRSAPSVLGVSGPDRAMLYAVAASTGLRRGELGTLMPESFHLDGPPPSVVCEAGYTKNGARAEQPIPTTLAGLLRPWLASKVPGKPVFGKLPHRTGQMLKADLRRCGIKPVDDSSRVVDMHSLRHGYITALAKAGTRSARYGP